MGNALHRAAAFLGHVVADIGIVHDQALEDAATDVALELGEHVSLYRVGKVPLNTGSLQGEMTHNARHRAPIPRPGRHYTVYKGPCGDSQAKGSPSSERPTSPPNMAACNYPWEKPGYAKATVRFPRDASVG